MKQHIRKQIRKPIKTAVLAMACLSSAGIAMARTPIIDGGGLRDGSRGGHGPDLEDIWIEDITSAGPGCVGGDYPAYGIFATNKQLLLDLTQVTVRKGANSYSRRAKRKMCQYLINLSYPAGWTFAVAAVKTNLRAKLKPGSMGRAGVSVYFQGNRGAASANVNLRGPKNIRKTGTKPLSNLVFAPCYGGYGRHAPAGMRALNVKLSALIRSGGGYGYDYGYGNGNGKEVVKIGGPTKLILKWKKCHSYGHGY